MYNTLIYLFDPLCGRCYGATPTLFSMAEGQGVTIELLPTGLFSGDGARPMDDNFAAYAWSNDQRIASFTGQIFTERYRQLVLGDRQQFLDSGPATTALTAVSLIAPEKELEALKKIQHARYVDGQDVTNSQTLSTILKSLGLEEAAAMVDSPDADVLAANSVRINRAQALLRQFETSSMPTFIADAGSRRWMLHASAVFSD